MASDQNDIVFPEEDLETSSQDDDDDDVVDDEELPDDDVIINSASPSTSPAASALLPVAVSTSISAQTVTVALPAVPNGNPQTTTLTTVIADPSPVFKTGGIDTVMVEKKPVIDDSRRLFQRLWTDEDEIELLQGFLEYTTHHAQYDTALFYNQIKSKLQLDFNKNQLVEKLRRLKKKYRNVVNKTSSGKEFCFKSPHDQATFGISRKIWSDLGRTGADDNVHDDDDSNFNHYNFNSNNIEVKTEDTCGLSVEKKTPKSRKRSQSQSVLRTQEQRGFNDNSTLYKDSNISNGGNLNCSSNNKVHGVIEETLRSCLSPLFKELLNSVTGRLCPTARGFVGSALIAMPLGVCEPFMNFGIGSGDLADDRWRKQQILELEVYSKRLELAQDQIKAALEELRSK